MVIDLIKYLSAFRTATRWKNSDAEMLNNLDKGNNRKLDKLVRKLHQNFKLINTEKQLTVFRDDQHVISEDDLLEVKKMSANCSIFYSKGELIDILTGVEDGQEVDASFLFNRFKESVAQRQEDYIYKAIEIIRESNDPDQIRAYANSVDYSLSKKSIYQEDLPCSIYQIRDERLAEIYFDKANYLYSKNQNNSHSDFCDFALQAKSNAIDAKIEDRFVTLNRLLQYERDLNLSILEPLGKQAANINNLIDYINSKNPNFPKTVTEHQSELDMLTPQIKKGEHLISQANELLEQEPEQE